MGISSYLLVEVDAAKASGELSDAVPASAAGVAAAVEVFGVITTGVPEGVLAASISAAWVATAASVAYWTSNVDVVRIGTAGVLVGVAVGAGAAAVGVWVGTIASTVVGVATTAAVETNGGR
jgi:hypothetical protein